MIRIVSFAYCSGSQQDSGGYITFEFDAEPWFDVATVQQLEELAQERVDCAAWSRKFYRGTQTENIWKYMVDKLPRTPELVRFLDAVNADRLFVNTEIPYAEEVDTYLLKLTIKKAAMRELDKMLEKRDRRINGTWSRFWSKIRSRIATILSGGCVSKI